MNLDVNTKVASSMVDGNETLGVELSCLCVHFTVFRWCFGTNRGSGFYTGKAVIINVCDCETRQNLRYKFLGRRRRSLGVVIGRKACIVWKCFHWRRRRSSSRKACPEKKLTYHNTLYLCGRE